MAPLSHSKNALPSVNIVASGEQAPAGVAVATAVAAAVGLTADAVARPSAKPPKPREATAGLKRVEGGGGPPKP